MRRREERNDLLAQLLARGDGAAVALEREVVLPLSGDAELARQHLGRLPHVEPAGEIGQSFHQRDARPQHAGTEARERAELLHRRARPHQALEPHAVFVGVLKRDLAHRFHAAGEDQPRGVALDPVDRRFHPRGAVPVHGEAGNAPRHTRAEGGHARRVRGLGGLRAVAEDDLVERSRIEILAREQLADRDPAELVDRDARERGARLRERRPNAAQDP